MAGPDEGLVAARSNKGMKLQDVLNPRYVPPAGPKPSQFHLKRRGGHFWLPYFQKQLKAFGMMPSFAFVREPETNGVAERFIRTLKEQIVFGRIYQDIEAVRAAVRDYFECYNQHWLLEKNGYRSPAETRQTWMAKTTTTHEAA
jgi:transposase InsO family protein